MVKWKAYFPFKVLFSQNTSWSRKLTLPPHHTHHPLRGLAWHLPVLLLWPHSKVQLGCGHNLRAFTLGTCPQLSSLPRFPCSGCKATSPKLGFQASGSLPILLKQLCPLPPPPPPWAHLSGSGPGSVSLRPVIHTRQGAR